MVFQISAKFYQFLLVERLNHNNYYFSFPYLEVFLTLLRSDRQERFLIRKNEEKVTFICGITIEGKYNLFTYQMMYFSCYQNIVSKRSPFIYILLYRSKVSLSFVNLLILELIISNSRHHHIRFKGSIRKYKCYCTFVSL